MNRVSRVRLLAVLMVVPVLLVLGACKTPYAPESAVRKVIVNGAELSYAEAGTGETVVFVHGLGMDLRMWERVRPYIAARYRFVAYSRRYHAPNAWPDEDGRTYTIAQHAEDLAALIRMLGVRRAHLVSTSLGGRVAVEAAMRHPELVASLVVGDSFVTLDVPSESAAILAAFSRGIEPMFEAIREGDAHLAAIRLVDWFSERRGAWDDLPEERKRYFRDNARTLLIAARDAGIDRRPTCEALRAIAPPVLVLDGVDTPAAARLTNDALYACLRRADAERFRVPRSRHAWYDENPAAGSDAILRFLARHPA